MGAREIIDQHIIPVSEDSSESSPSDTELSELEKLKLKIKKKAAYRQKREKKLQETDWQGERLKELGPLVKNIFFYQNRNVLPFNTLVEKVKFIKKIKGENETKDIERLIIENGWLTVVNGWVKIHHEQETN